MMRVKYINEYGTLEWGGGQHPSLNIIDKISGLGLPNLETKTVNYEGFDGAFPTDEKYLSRAITFNFDLQSYDLARETRRILKILSKQGTLQFLFGNTERSISVTQKPTVSDFERTHAIRGFTVQFICDYPFFTDLTPTKEICYGAEKRINGNQNLTEPFIWTAITTKAPIHNNGDFKVFPKFYILNTGTADADATEGIGYEIMKVRLDYDLSADTLPEEKDIISKFYLPITTKVGEEITINFDARDENNRYCISSVQGDILNKRSDDSTLDFFLDIGENKIVVKNYNSNEQIICYVEYDNRYLEATY